MFVITKWLKYKTNKGLSLPGNIKRGWSLYNNIYVLTGIKHQKGLQKS